jgi:competence/damage-inducible protein CinA-like protein
LSDRPRAAVLLTGSELVRGSIRDANGAFLARELTRLGLEPARWLVVGDRPEELEAALREALQADICVISGGLGPTHDDRTVELLARATGRELHVDGELEAEIDGVARAVAERLGRPHADLATGVRKQASLPEGAVSLGLAGTAPALLLEHEGRVAVALPGPPGELHRLWPNALAAEPFRRIVDRATTVDQRVLRFFGVPEALVAETVESAGGEGEGLELTICARNLEIEVDLLVSPGGERRAGVVEEALEGRFAADLFARDDRSVAELVLDRCRELGLTLATAESCTGGLVAAELTEIPGSSDAFVGSIVAYSNEVKGSTLGVPEALLEAHGAVSEEVARAMAEGVRERLGADVAISVTGVAGPGGGTAEKPVGLVYVGVSGPDGTEMRELRLSGSRREVRERATAVSLHEVRRLLARSVTG